MTAGKFPEALEAFSALLTATAVLVVGSRQDVAHLKEGQTVENTAVRPVRGQRPVCLPGPSDGAGRSCAPQSAA